jgi:hypothetical protein
MASHLLRAISASWMWSFITRRHQNHWKKLEEVSAASPEAGRRDHSLRLADGHPRLGRTAGLLDHKGCDSHV